MSNLGFGMVSLAMLPGGGPELADDAILSIVEDKFDLTANQPKMSVNRLAMRRTPGSRQTMAASRASSSGRR